ncbi:hypothetical protein AMECASPLE_020947 [Ameca splendens]|uniref:Uncharacterized protein n=1 Tax=Ameca splendens TaxID=208324 RepID=A0ABV1A027_9TELE
MRHLFSQLVGLVALRERNRVTARGRGGAGGKGGKHLEGGKEERKGEEERRERRSVWDPSERTGGRWMGGLRRAGGWVNETKADKSKTWTTKRSHRQSYKSHGGKNQKI